MKITEKDKRVLDDAMRHYIRFLEKTNDTNSKLYQQYADVVYKSFADSAQKLLDEAQETYNRVIKK